MKLRRLISPLIILSISYTIAFADSPSPTDMNPYVLKIVNSYPLDGTYKYSWPKKGEDGQDPYDGVTRNIYYLGQKILRGDGKKDSYCCGITLEVFLTSVDSYHITQNGGVNISTFLPAEDLILLYFPIKGLDTTNFSNFKYLWFCPKLDDMGPGEALTTYGMGTIVKDWSQAKSGDFVQFWRWNGSGHSAIFMNWERDSTTDAVIGFKYWSSQGKGIAYNTEYFGDSGKTVDRKRLFLSRVTDPTTWK